MEDAMGSSMLCSGTQSCTSSSSSSLSSELCDASLSGPPLWSCSPSNCSDSYSPDWKLPCDNSTLSPTSGPACTCALPASVLCAGSGDPGVRGLARMAASSAWALPTRSLAIQPASGSSKVRSMSSSSCSTRARSGSLPMDSSCPMPTARAWLSSAPFSACCASSSCSMCLTRAIAVLRISQSGWKMCIARPTYARTSLRCRSSLLVTVCSCANASRESETGAMSASRVWALSMHCHASRPTFAASLSSL
mmetsp:Transcript_39113/g.92415  ORF Transcript_39113/g.92415 Transcript_39113/m.92415 type:complete len:250 (+) Transcript_39113:94-843(+)